MLVAIILFIPVFNEYLATGLVPRFPTLIMAVTLALAAIQTFIGGLVLDTVVKKDRQRFEHHLYLLELELHKMRIGLIEEEE